jgi:hypothetical protein
MAVKVLYLSDAVITAAVLATLTETDPAGSADENQGWTCDKKASPNYSELYPDTVRAATTFVTTEPSAFSAHGYRTAATLNGTFANSNWVLAYKVKCNTYYAQDGVLKFRLWRSANTDGSGAAQVTPGWQASGTIAFTAANQYQTGSITWVPGGTVTLTNEYLFLELEWSATVSGGNNAAAVYFVEEEGAAEALTTPDYTDNTPVDKSLADSGSGADLQTIAGTSSLADSGAGADALASLQAALALAEAGAGADALSVVQELLISLADSGAGEDLLSIVQTVEKALSDSGSGLDAMSTDDAGGDKAINETGAGVEALTLAIAVLLADSGSGSDVQTIAADIFL